MTIQSVVYPESWFRKKFVVAENGCWNWIASADGRGRGQVNINGRPIRAHVVSWLIFRGEVGGQCVLHKCDNPRCVNPDHLFLGSQDANMKDAARKGHHVKCVSNLMAAEIVKAFNAGTTSPTALARQFGVSRSSVRWAIVHRQHTAQDG